MVLSIPEYQRYINTHLRLLHFCYCKIHENNNELSFEQFIKKPIEAKSEARNFFNANSYLLHEYIEKNSNLPGSDKEILLGFNLKLSSKFVILKQLKSYAIFMDIETDKFYAVLALFDPFQKIIDCLPVLVKATILPFNDKIIYDGFLTRETYIGKNMEKNMLNQYKESKVNKLIIKRLTNIKDNL
ncbi:MAG: hypothetical protein HQ541_21990 [Mariniphaga sp.]|nr:hypothetical protein [Mariniphaga sp.]